MRNNPKYAPLAAFYGGTFDPIHYGHLRPVSALAQQVGLERITLLPNNVPPHRPQPEASAAQRLAMVRLAVADDALFNVDDRELQRATPSYSIDTLEALRRERGERQPLAFIIGQDSLQTLHLWHRWQDLLSVCHLLVCARPGYSATLATPELQSWLARHRTREARALHRQAHGLIYLADTPLLDISASEIRQRRHCRLAVDDLLPPAVLHYIDTYGLYRRA